MTQRKWLALAGAATLLIGVAPSARSAESNDAAYKEALRQSVEQRIQLRKQAVQIQAEQLLREGNAAPLSISGSGRARGVVHEVEPNNTMAEATSLMNAIRDAVGAAATATSSSGGVCLPDIHVEVIGSINPAKDVDVYSGIFRKGDRIKVDIDGQREGAPLDLNLKIYGPFDPTKPTDCGTEIATRDDGNGLNGSSLDPCSFVSIPADGKYFIEVDDLLGKRGGNDQTYRLLLTIYAYVEQPLCFSPAIRDTVGAADCTGTTSSSSMTASLIDDVGATDNAVSSSGSAGLDCTPNTATVAGTLSAPKETDCYAVTLFATQTINAHVVGKQCANFIGGATNLGQIIDPTLTVLDSSSAVVASNDDTEDVDSAVFYTAPADGTYMICVGDHFLNGTPNHMYELNVLRQCNTEVEPNNTCPTAMPVVCHQ